MKTLPKSGGLFEQDNDLMEYFSVIENQIGIEEHIESTRGK